MRWPSREFLRNGTLFPFSHLLEEDIEENGGLPPFLPRCSITISARRRSSPFFSGFSPMFDSPGKKRGIPSPNSSLPSPSRVSSSPMVIGLTRVRLPSFLFSLPSRANRQAPSSFPSCPISPAKTELSLFFLTMAKSHVFPLFLFPLSSLSLRE